MNAEYLLQYSQKSTWCWGVESTPQCHSLSSTLFCWSVLVLTRASKGSFTSSVCADYLLPFSLICNILYSSPCVHKCHPLPAKCLPKHPHNHHTVLICGFAMSIQHDTSYCSTIFLMLIKVLYIYLTPSFHQWTGQRSRYSDWLQAGRSGDQILVGARFSAPVQTGPGAHPASCTMGTGSFPGDKERSGPDSDPSPPSSAVVKKG